MPYESSHTHHFPLPLPAVEDSRLAALNSVSLVAYISPHPRDAASSLVAARKPRGQRKGKALM